MDDGAKQPHSFGNGQQRNHHSRPFFYIQPPSQPYYLYQHWQMNSPYSHYGLPGGFNFGRPCLHPYQYMQYPGFVFPHAPIYPVDCRRMFEPRFHTPPWNDMPRQQHPSQPPGHREMTCSEAQTDPSDTITKIIECLDKMQGSGLQGGERELDSGIASQSSGMFSLGVEKKSEEQGAAHILPSARDDSCSEPQAAVFSVSTTAVYDGDSSHRSLEVLSPPDCWSGELDELPIDSSSVHEEGLNVEQAIADEQLLTTDDIQSDVVVTDHSAPSCGANEVLKRSVDAMLPSPVHSSSQALGDDQESVDKASKSDHQSTSLHKVKVNPSYQILKLPFDNVLASGAAAMSHLSSSSPYCYDYLSMQPTHERVSVLSPSLDELSSKDEMFSTDLEDVDLFPKHVYTGRRLSEIVDECPEAAEELDAVWTVGSRRLVCACCGKSLPKGAGRSKVQCAKVYVDEGGESEDEGRYSRGCEQPIRVVVRKNSVPKKTHSFPLRHVAKPWCKRAQHKDQSAPNDQEKDHGLCKVDPTDMEVGDMTSSELQCRTCQDRLCRGELTASDQGRWAEGGLIPRRRQSTPLQRQEMNTQRKAMHHRQRDDEPPLLHWERGSTVRGESPC